MVNVYDVWLNMCVSACLYIYVCVCVCKFLHLLDMCMYIYVEIMKLFDIYRLYIQYKVGVAGGCEAAS